MYALVTKTCILGEKQDAHSLFHSVLHHTHPLTALFIIFWTELLTDTLSPIGNMYQLHLCQGKHSKALSPGSKTIHSYPMQPPRVPAQPNQTKLVPFMCAQSLCMSPKGIYSFSIHKPKSPPCLIVNCRRAHLSTLFQGENGWLAQSTTYLVLCDFLEGTWLILSYFNNVHFRSATFSLTSTLVQPGTVGGTGGIEIVLEQHPNTKMPL